MSTIDDAAPRRPRFVRTRSIIAAILIVLGLVLAPIAAVGAWARGQLVDTDRFVSTFAPLAEAPQVQSFVATQVTTTIEESIDIPALVGDVFDGLLSLDLPPRAASALSLLEGPAADGVSSVIASTVDDVVASPRFSQVWTEALQFSHAHATAILRGEPGRAIQLGDDGTLSLELGVVIAEVRGALIERGTRFAEAIPDVNRSVPLVQSDALASVRIGYLVATAVGYWLPWVALALITAGVVLARRRLPTLARTAAGFASVFALLAVALRVGSGAFIAAVSPSIMPAETAMVMFDQLTSLFFSTVIALTLLGTVTAVAAWISGRGRSATALRHLAESGFAAVRAAGEQHGVSTGAFGTFVYRWRRAIFACGSLIAGAAIILSGPVSVTSVVAAVMALLILIMLVGLVQRPPVSHPQLHRAEGH